MTKELKHDFALAKEIIRRCGDLFETESFYNNKTIPVLLALAYEQSRRASYGWRTKVASIFGYFSYDNYLRAVEKLF